MRYLLKMMYDGTRYGGYQRQANADTVGERLLTALQTLFGQVEHMAGCSRTDSGVHALMFCVSFDAAQERDSQAVVRALNALLPDDICVTGCQRVADDFHARYSCRGKQYLYQIRDSALRNPFYDRYALTVAHALDIQQLNQIVLPIIGTHDFTSFMASGSKITDCVRTVTRADFAREGELIRFRICADGFLYHMVRIIVGTVLDIAEGRLEADMAKILAAKDRSAAGRTIAAHGLFLEKVFYAQQTDM